ncbi:MAG: flippase [Chloroflexaceae bacterium]|nr:flippase [Chloroflexaceae bacterium]
MTSNVQIIAKNIGALMSSQLLTWSLTLLLTIVLPRQLGPAQIGQFYLAISLWAIATVLCKFGTDVAVTRAIARAPEQAPRLVGATLAARALTFTGGAVAVGCYVALLDYPPAVVGIVAVVGLAGVFELAADAFMSALRGLERMEFISLGLVANKLVYSLLALAAVLIFDASVFWIAWLYVVGSCALLAVVARSYLRLHPLVLPSLREVAPLLRAGAPYLLVSLIVVVYNEVDKQVIAALIGERAVGYYTTAATLFSTVMFVPVTLTTALFPLMARSFDNAADALRRINRKSFNIMFLVGIPVGFGMMAIAPALISLIYGPEFAPAGPILALMGVVVVFVYLNILIAQILVSTERVNRWTIVLGIATVVTIVLDILLVPWSQRVFNNGALTGAITFLITEAGQTMVGIFLIPRGTLTWLNVTTAARALFAGLVMVGVCWLTRDRFILVPVLLGAATYAGLIAALRVVPGEDVQTIRQLAGQAIARLGLRRGQTRIT